MPDYAPTMADIVALAGPKGTMKSDVAIGAKAEFSQLERKIEKVGQAFERSEKTVKELTKTVGQLERENAGLKKTQESTFGSVAISQLTSYATAN